MNGMNIMQHAGLSILPGRYERDESGKLVQIEPDRPAPNVMTAEEAIRYLRIDETETKNPQDTLARYRTNGMLKGTQIGRAVRYLRSELDAFLIRQTQAVAR